jgi:PAS domain S-box-containing protein
MNYTKEYVKKLQEENQRLKRFIASSNKKVLRELFESHQAIMLIIDMHSGQILDANAAATSFYKYSKEALLKLKIEDLNMFPAPDIKEERMKILRGEQNYFIFPHRLADGTIRKVEVYSSLYEINKKPVLFSIIHDVTERTEAEKYLRKNEEKFVSAFKSNPNSMIISNLDDGKIYDVNDAFFELTGLSRNEIIGETTLSIDLYVNPDDRNKMIQVLKKTGSVRNMEIKLRHRSGRLLTVLISGELLKTSHDRTIIVTMLDITQRVQLENQLESNHTLLQAIFDSVPAMVTVYNPNLQQIEVNKEFERVTGWTKEDIGTGNIMELVYPDPDYREIAAEFMQSLQTGFKDFILTGKDGDEIESIWANVKLEDERQVGIGIDIRDRKKIEQELQQKNMHLTKLNEVLDDFVKIAAHDLRSPIHNLKEINELIKQQPTHEEKLSLIEMLGPITNRLQHTVESLMENVNLQIQHKQAIGEISFHRIWHEVLEELTSQIESYEGKIDVDFDEIPKIRYIRVYLVSILRNLVSNAIKYSAKNKNPFIKITTHKKDKYILLTVADNGIGIDIKNAGTELFKPFKRFTLKAEGTGMGLYIVNNIVERNGGYIRVESQIRKGTTFYCYLMEYPEG